MVGLFGGGGAGFELDVSGERLAVKVRSLRPRNVPAAVSIAERGVLELVVAGLTDAEIGRARGTSRRTVSNQVARLLRLYRVHSRVEMIVAALRD